MIVLAENIPGGTGLRSQEFSIDLANSGPTLERRTLPEKCATLLLGPEKKLCRHSLGLWLSSNTDEKNSAEFLLVANSP